MGTIAVNVTDETETFFRETVQEKLGTEKGVLGKALDEAMKKWAEEKMQNEIAERQLNILKNGFHLGYGKIKITREELYDRSN